MVSRAEAGEASGLAPLRRFLLALFVLGLVGLGTELALLGHYEDPWQWTPLVLLSLAAAAVVGVLLRPGARTFRFFRAVAGLLVLGGLLGVALHLKGNAEFEREMVPSLGGFDLIRETLTGATPALAPGALMYLGLLGWAATKRPPAQGRGTQ